MKSHCMPHPTSPQGGNRAQPHTVKVIIVAHMRLLLMFQHLVRSTLMGLDPESKHTSIGTCFSPVRSANLAQMSGKSDPDRVCFVLLCINHGMGVSVNELEEMSMAYCSHPSVLKRELHGLPQSCGGMSHYQAYKTQQLACRRQ